MRKAGKLFALLGLPLLVLAVLFWRERAESAPEIQKLVMAALDAPVTAAKPQPGAPAVLVRPAVSENIRKEFESSQNYAAFIHSALQRQGEGGIFYATAAHTRCITAKALRPHALLKGDAALLEKSTRRIEDLQGRCNGVQVDNKDLYNFARQKKYANAKAPDALMSEPYVAFERDVAKVKAQLVHARSSGDPYLMFARIEQHIAYLAPAIDDAYQTDAHGDVLFAALAAAHCTLLGDCNDNLQLHKICFHDGICQFTDLRDYLRAELPVASLPLFEKTVKAVLKMAGKG